MKPRFLPLLVLSSLLPREGRAAFPCFEKFAALGAKIAKYGSEVKDSYGLRVLLRDARPEEAEADQRLLLLWKKLPPGKLPFRERAWNRTRRLLGGSPAEPGPGDRYQLDVMGGVDHVLQTPLNLATEKMVDAGWLETEKRLTLPALVVLSTPFWNRVNEEEEARVDRVHVAVHHHKLDQLVRNDFRFAKVKAQLEKEGRAYRDARKAHAPPAELEKRHAQFLASVYETASALEAAHEDYQKIAARYQELYAAARTPAETARLDRQRVLELAEHPLFADIPGTLKMQSVQDWQNPAKFGAAEALITQRELLFYRYHLVPSAIEARPSAGRPKGSGEANQIAEIQGSPVYKDLLPAFRSGKLSYGQFQRALMEDAYWELERFGSWRILGRSPPPRLDENGNPTGAPLEPGEIRAQITKAYLEPGPP